MEPDKEDRENTVRIFRKDAGEKPKKAEIPEEDKAEILKVLNEAVESLDRLDVIRRQNWVLSVSIGFLIGLVVGWLIWGAK